MVRGMVIVSRAFGQITCTPDSARQTLVIEFSKDEEDGPEIEPADSEGWMPGRNCRRRLDSAVKVRADLDGAGPPRRRFDSVRTGNRAGDRRGHESRESA